MRRSVLVFIALVSCLAQAQDGPKPISVLFVGNSYTYFHNLPQLFEKIVSPHRPVVTGMLTVGGMTLLGHSVRPQLEAALHKRQWDYVVLQEQSTLTNDFTVDGVARIVDPKPFWAALHTMVSKVRAARAKPVLYMTWKRKHAPSRDEAMVEFAYYEGARREGCNIAPVGRAWEEFLKREPDAELYFTDGSHPSELGSYIAAATIAKRICWFDLAKLPTSFQYLPVDLESEKLGTTPTTLSLSGAQVRDVALAVGAAFASKSLRDEPAPIVEPTLTAGEPTSVAKLVGSYWGTFKLFRESPMVIQFEFDDKGEGIATIITAPKSAGISSTIHVTSKNRTIRFDIPLPRNRYDVTFRGTLHAGKLEGLCEARYTEDYTERTELGTDRGKRGQLVAFGPWIAGQ